MRKRFLAGAVDLALGGLPLWLLSPLIVSLAASGSEDKFVAGVLLIGAVVVSLVFHYVVQLTQLCRSRPTLGYRLLGLEVTDGDGRPASWNQMLRRILLGSLTPVLLLVWLSLPTLLVLGPLIALVHPRGRSLSDLVSGATVTTAARPPEADPVPPR